MKKLILIFLIFNLFNKGYSQKHNIDYYNNFLIEQHNNFFNSVTKKELWRDYESDIDNALEDIDNDLSRGSGMTFYEMNDLRIIKSRLTTLKLFGDGIAVGGYEKMFNTDTKNKILEIFPEMKFEYYSSFKNLNIYKISFKNYIVLAARHNNIGDLMKVSWYNSKRDCVTIKGYFNMFWGVYKIFWSNEQCRNIKNPKIIISGFDYLKNLDFIPSTVKPD